MLFFSVNNIRKILYYNTHNSLMFPVFSTALHVYESRKLQKCYIKLSGYYNQYTGTNDTFPFVQLTFLLFRLIANDGEDDYKIMKKKTDSSKESNRDLMVYKPGLTTGQIITIFIKVVAIKWIRILIQIKKLLRLLFI